MSVNPSPESVTVLRLIPLTSRNSSNKVDTVLFQEIVNKKVGCDAKKISKLLILYHSYFFKNDRYDFLSGIFTKRGILSSSKKVLRRSYLPYFRRQPTKKSEAMERKFRSFLFCTALTSCKTVDTTNALRENIHIFSKILRANLRNGAPFRQKAKIFFALNILRKSFFQKNQNFETKF